MNGGGLCTPQIECLRSLRFSAGAAFSTVHPSLPRFSVDTSASQGTTQPRCPAGRMSVGWTSPSASKLLSEKLGCFSDKVKRKIWRTGRESNPLSKRPRSCNPVPYQPVPRPLVASPGNDPGWGPYERPLVTMTRRRNGGYGRNRTSDAQGFNLPLYRLSYASVNSGRVNWPRARLVGYLYSAPHTQQMRGVCRQRLQLVGHAGFEPCFSALRGRRPSPSSPMPHMGRRRGNRTTRAGGWPPQPAVPCVDTIGSAATHTGSVLLS